MARNFTKKVVLAAIKDSYGVVGTVAKHLKCDWTTAKKYIEKWPETTQAMADARESYLDMTENACIDRINAGDGQMIRFVLATLGKKRGYGTEDAATDTSGATDTEVNISVNGGEPAPAEADA
jgi:hypothetical protein